MKRRRFLKLLAAIPLALGLRPSESEAKPELTNTKKWLTRVQEKEEPNTSGEYPFDGADYAIDGALVDSYIRAPGDEL